MTRLKEEDMGDFVVMDCSLLRRMSGLPPAFNLRELRDRIAVCSENVLYHHFCETSLRATFDDPEYRNDFAVWSKEQLADRVLAERLGIVDPYEKESTTALRQDVLDIIEDRLSELSPWVPTVRPGGEFYLMESTTVAFDTGERITKPSDLVDAVAQMTNGSIYFHFLEGLRRPPLRLDDFSAWLAEQGPGGEPYAAALTTVDSYFKTLPALRQELCDVLARVEEAGS